ncbi:MAG TPA: HEAT repeat domain-containing protein [Verrucomicrobiae bacterium]|nr:HEAT repeat domain-containing protein [Verrucomicrobiae bacterium]
MKPAHIARYLATLAIAALASHAFAADAPAPSPADIDTGLASIKEYDYGQTRENLVKISDIIAIARKDKAALAKVEKAMAGFIEGEASLASKQFVCGQLGYIGTDASVPALAKLLASDDTADMARMALERIPGDVAEGALIDATKKTEGLHLVGLLNTLGERRAKKAEAVLEKSLKSTDAGVMTAAAAALGKLGSPDGVKALEEARSKAPAGTKAIVEDAILVAADRMRAAGDKAEAKAIYDRAVHNSDFSVQARAAAFEGLARCGGDVTDLIKGALAPSGEPMLQQLVFALIREIPTSIPTAKAAELLSTLSPDLQVRMIAALEDRGDKQAHRPIAELAKSSKENLVKAAALAALAKLGDDSDIAVLVAAAAGNDKEPKESAEFSLSRLAAKGTDEALLKQLADAPEAEKTVIIKAIAARNMASGVPALFTEAKGQNQRVRVEAVRALGEVAPPKSLPELVALQLATENPAEQAEIEKAVVATARRTPEGQPKAKLVLAALEKADKDAAKASIFRALGMLGDPDGLAPLKGALGGGSDELRTAAIKALNEWPDATPLNDLLEAAKSAPAPAQKLLAWRAFIKLASLNEKENAAGALANYKTAIETANDDGIKRLALSRIAGIPNGGAMKLAAAQLEKESLRAEAEAAILKIAGKMKPDALAKTKETLQKLADSGSTDDVKKQAKNLLKKAGG